MLVHLYQVYYSMSKKPVTEKGKKKKMSLDDLKSSSESPNSLQMIEEVLTVSATTDDKEIKKSNKITNQQRISFGGKATLTIEEVVPVKTTDVRKFLDSDQQHYSVLIQDTTQQLPSSTDNILKKRSDLKDRKEIRDLLGQHQGTGTGTFKNMYKIVDTSNCPKDVCCWWCCNPFENEPLPCPVSYNKSLKKFNVKGVFCGIPCIAAYSVERYGTLENVYNFKNCIEPETDPEESLIVAPAREFLKMFGGPLSIEDFRNRSGIKNYISVKSTDDISYINQYLLETTE